MRDETKAAQAKNELIVLQDELNKVLANQKVSLNDRT